MREWTEVGFSSIYYLLKKLERNGLIQAHSGLQTGLGPTRKVYHITPAGQTRCREATLEALSVPRRHYPPLQLRLGLANLPGTSPRDAVAALEAYCRSLRDRLYHLRARQDEQRPLPFHVEAMFNLSAAVLEAELGWVERFAKKLHQEGGDTTKPGGKREWQNST